MSMNVHWIGVTILPKATGVKLITRNKKAYHEYHILEKYEAGIELFGTEVKSIRAGNINLKDAFCIIKNGELFTQGMHVSPYEKGNIFNRDPMRSKRLLMHKKEINRLNARIMQDGLALIPLSAYFKSSRVKLEIGLARGKKLHDKRDSATKRTSERDMQRNIKEKNM
jgi:SsrA-binding protein